MNDAVGGRDIGVADGDDLIVVPHTDREERQLERCRAVGDCASVHSADIGRERAFEGGNLRPLCQPTGKYCIPRCFRLGLAYQRLRNGNQAAAPGETSMRDRCVNQVWIDIERHRIDINKDGCRAAVNDAVGCRDVGVADGDDLIVVPHTDREECQLERCRAVGDCASVHSADIGRERPFEGGNLRPLCQPTRKYCIPRCFRLGLAYQWLGNGNQAAAPDET